MSQTFIRIKEVDFIYPSARSSTVALSNINLEIPKGKVFGLLGPNGAGKSTLLSLLSGITSLQNGTIQVYNEHSESIALADKIKKVKRFSAIVPQEYAFYEALTIQENLAFFAGLLFSDKNIKAVQIKKCVEACQLTEVLNKPAGHCSGGLKRRLNLAIGLLGDPELLYLDEPTVGIDTQSRRFILEKIKSLQAGGMTIIYTSHYFEEVQALCDKVAVINQGKVIYQHDLASDKLIDGMSLEERYIQLLQEEDNDKEHEQGAFT